MEPCLCSTVVQHSYTFTCSTMQAFTTNVTLARMLCTAHCIADEGVLCITEPVKQSLCELHELAATTIVTAVFPAEPGLTGPLGYLLHISDMGYL